MGKTQTPMSPATQLPRPAFALFRFLLLVSFSFALSGFAAEAKRGFDVPAGEAGTTLKQFAQQAGQQVVYAARDVRGVQTAAVKGEFTMRAALEHMLENTDL